jgi:cholesterol transport system auxiliary component
MKMTIEWGHRPQRRRLVFATLTLFLLSGCQGIGQLSPHPNYYSLADAGDPVTALQPRPAAAATAPTLIVSAPHASAGFDSQRIVYLRRADQPEYFAHNDWIDTPARMLAPMIVAAVGRSGAYGAVVQAPSTVAGEMRLDTEILRLQHEFLATPSRVRLSLRAYLVDSATRRVIASREFEATVTAGSEDPHGGVVAANGAAKAVLEELSAFCAEAARSAASAK